MRDVLFAKRTPTITQSSQNLTALKDGVDSGERINFPDRGAILAEEVIPDASDFGLLSLSQRNYETLKIVPELVSPESTLGIIRILRGLTFFLATQAVVVGVDMR